jgi:hypothetical protein
VILSFLRNLVSHITAIGRKTRSTEQDIARLRPVHRNFARLNHMEAVATSSEVAPQPHMEQAYPVSKKQQQLIRDVIQSEEGKKTQGDWRKKTGTIRKRIRARKGGAQARWVGGR